MITDYVKLKGLFVDYRDTFNMAFFLLKNPLKPRQITCSKF